MARVDASPIFAALNTFGQVSMAEAERRRREKSLERQLIGTVGLGAISALAGPALGALGGAVGGGGGQALIGAGETLGAGLTAGQRFGVGAKIGGAVAGGDPLGVVQGALAGVDFSQQNIDREIELAEQTEQKQIRQSAIEQLRGTPERVVSGPDLVGGVPGQDITATIPAVQPDLRGGLTTLLESDRLGGAALSGLVSQDIARQRTGQVRPQLRLIETSPGVKEVRDISQVPEGTKFGVAPDLSGSFGRGAESFGKIGETPPFQLGSAKTEKEAFELGRKQAELLKIKRINESLESDESSGDRLDSLKSARAKLRKMGTSGALRQAAGIQDEIDDITSRQGVLLRSPFAQKAVALGFDPFNLDDDNTEAVTKALAEDQAALAGTKTTATEEAKIAADLDRPIDTKLARELNVPIGTKKGVVADQHLDRLEQSPISAGEREKFKDAKNLTALANDIMVDYHPSFVGPIAGRNQGVKNAIGFSITGKLTAREARFFSNLAKLRNIVLKVRSGGAVVDQEMNRALEELPTMVTPAVAFDPRMQNFIVEMNRASKIGLDLFGEQPGGGGIKNIDNMNNEELDAEIEKLEREAGG